MAVLTFPTIFPQNESWSFVSKTQTFKSDLTGKEQHAELPGSYWSASLTFSKLSRPNGRALAAFVSSLKGKAGRCYITPYEARTVLGNPLGAPVVNGADQTGGALITSGWASSVEVLKAGDYFEVNGELKLVTQDVVSSAVGSATINFVPDLRTAPVDTAPISTTNPRSIMRLANDSQASWQLSQDKYYSINLQFIEAI